MNRVLGGGVGGIGKGSASSGGRWEKKRGDWKRLPKGGEKGRIFQHNTILRDSARDWSHQNEGGGTGMNSYSRREVTLPPTQLRTESR